MAQVKLRVNSEFRIPISNLRLGFGGFGNIGWVESMPFRVLLTWKAINAYSIAFHHDCYGALHCVASRRRPSSSGLELVHHYSAEASKHERTRCVGKKAWPWRATTYMGPQGPAHVLLHPRWMDNGARLELSFDLADQELQFSNPHPRLVHCGRASSLAWSLEGQEDQQPS